MCIRDSIYTIYPGAPPWPFVIAGLVMGLFAVLAPVKALARASELFRWLLVLALVPILVLGFLEADVETLTPVYFSDAVPVLEGALSALGTGAFLLLNIGFLERGPGELRRGRFCLGAALLMALLMLLTSMPLTALADSVVSSVPFTIDALEDVYKRQVTGKLRAATGEVSIEKTEVGNDMLVLSLIHI